VRALYEVLGFPGERISQWSDVVSYTNSKEFLAVPAHPLTDSAQLKKLRDASRGEAPNTSIRFEAFDFDAIRKMTVMDSDAALKAAAAAFASAGLHLEMATPSVGNTVLTASYVDESGATVSVDQKIDTKVSYRFSAGNGMPFTGPGSALQVTFDSKGKATQLYYAWREVRKGEQVRIISEAQARKRIGKLLPKGAKIRMRLVYWCPPFDNAAALKKELGPVSIIPWYSFTAVTETTDPATGKVTETSTRERLIPATDDPKYVPTITRFDVSGSGGTKVEGSISVTGGRKPYTFLWSASSPAALASRGPTVSYAPLARVFPPPGATSNPNQTVPLRETVSVTVVDANGITYSTSQTIPVLAQPIVPRSHGGPGGDASFGCESPAEPEEWVQERVGWQEGMSNPGAGTQEFCWLGDDSWPGDYIRPTPPGSLTPSPWINGDADYANWGIDTANLVFINGDGCPNWLTAMFPGAPESDYNNDVYLWRPGNSAGTVQMPSGYTNVNYNGSWGPEGPNDRLYWLAGLLCDCLDAQVAGGLSPTDRWGPAFGGLHIYTGFASEAAYSAGAFGKAFGENILGASGPAQTIVSGWFNASTSTVEGTAAAIGPITTGGVSDFNDFYVGKGTMGPSIAPSMITGWWYLHQ
jgi:hypothetical protein